MRSPLQLIKSLTSRRKVEEVSEPGREVAQDHELQVGLEAAPDSSPTFPVEDNKPSERSNPPEAETDEPDSVFQTDPLLSEHVSDDAPDPQDQPSLAAPVVQAAERKLSASASARGQKEHQVDAVQAQKDLTRPAVVKRAAQRPEAKRKTILEEAIELEHEINDLRSRLSAKLIEQNRQLRRMLGRYNDD